MYKIISPFLLQGCKDDKVLAKMIDLLPVTEDPLAKRPKDIAFSAEYLSQFDSDDELAKDVRQTFANHARLKAKRKLITVKGAGELEGYTFHVKPHEAFDVNPNTNFIK